jgi:hypothetical protein
MHQYQVTAVVVLPNGDRVCLSGQVSQGWRAVAEAAAAAFEYIYSITAAEDSVQDQWSQAPDLPTLLAIITAGRSGCGGEASQLASC